MGQEERFGDISRRRFMKIIGAVTLEALLSSTNTFSQNIGEKAKSRITLQTDGSIFESEGQRLIKEVEEADKIVSNYFGMLFDGPYLGMSWDGTYKIDVSTQHRTSRALLFVYKGNRGYTEFPTRGIKRDNAAVIHEVTHVIAPNYNRFLAEGLAVYVQDKFSQKSVPPIFGTDLHRATTENETIPLEQLIKETKDHFYYWSRAKIGTPEMTNAYFHAGSFVKFLIENDVYCTDEKSRLDRFKKLYALADKAESKMFDIVYGKSLLEIEKEWRSYIEKRRSELPQSVIMVNNQRIGLIA